jgi:hypothetical protein
MSAISSLAGGSSFMRSISQCSRVHLPTSHLSETKVNFFSDLHALAREVLLTPDS